MTYSDAKGVLRDALYSAQGDFMSRLLDSPGRLSAVDSSTVGKLPTEQSYADEILRALLIVRRHIIGVSVVDRDLVGCLVELAPPIRVLAADSRYAETRIPQLSLILDVICLTCLA